MHARRNAARKRLSPYNTEEQSEEFSEWCKGTYYTNQYLPQLKKGQAAFCDFLAKYGNCVHRRSGNTTVASGGTPSPTPNDAVNTGGEKTRLETQTCSKDNTIASDSVDSTRCDMLAATSPTSESIHAEDPSFAVSRQQLPKACSPTCSQVSENGQLKSPPQPSVPADAATGDTNSCTLSAMATAMAHTAGDRDEARLTQKHRKPRSSSRKKRHRMQNAALMAPARSMFAFSELTAPRESEQGLCTDEVRKKLYFSYAQMNEANRVTYSLPALLTPFTRSLYRYYTEDEWGSRARNKSHLDRRTDVHGTRSRTSLAHRHGQVDTIIYEHVPRSADAPVTPVAISANAYPPGPSGPPPFRPTTRRRVNRSSQ